MNRPIVKISILLLLTIGAIETGCFQSSNPKDSSGSNWLKCKTDSDCYRYEYADRCQSGFCVDSQGERIVAAGTADDAGTPNTGRAADASSSTNTRNATEAGNSSDAALPDTFFGLFHYSEDAGFNLRINPDGTFAWGISGCDFFGGDTGVWTLESDKVVLLPQANRIFFTWAGGYIFAADVERIELTATEEGLRALSETRTTFEQRWIRGGMCLTCSETEPYSIACDDPYLADEPSALGDPGDVGESERPGGLSFYDAFSLYLLKDNETDSTELDQNDLDSVELAEEPLLTASDIAAYHWTKHVFVLRKDSTVEFPIPGVAGIPFVVVSRNQRQYVGAFWTDISSKMYFEPTISVPYNLSNSDRTFRIEWEDLGFSEDTDPRNSPIVETALGYYEGKLTESVYEHSMKGYEIYSWDAGDEDWRFTLVDGTNVSKSCEEVTTHEYRVGQGLLIADNDLDSFLGELLPLPEGEQIVWRSSLAQCPQIEMPDAETVETIEQACLVLDLQLSLQPTP